MNNDTLEQNRWTGIHSFFLCLLVLTLVYIVLYFSNVYPQKIYFSTGRGPWQLQARYHVMQETSEIVFSPIHTLDRHLFRPNRWQVW